MKRQSKTIIYIGICIVIFCLCMIIITEIDNKDLAFSHGIDITEYMFANGQISDFLIDGHVLTSTSSDPWILLNTAQFPAIQCVKFSCRKAFWGDSQLYYAQNEEMLSETNSVFADIGGGGKRFFSIPKDKYSSLRFDFTNQTNQIIELESIVLYEKAPFGLSQVVKAFILCLLLCIVLSLIVFKEICAYLWRTIIKYRKIVLSFSICSLILLLCFIVVITLDGKDLTLSQGIDITEYVLENGLFSGFVVDGKTLTSTSSDPWILLDTTQFPEFKSVEFSYQKAFEGDSQLYYAKSGEVLSEINSVFADIEDGNIRCFSLQKEEYSSLRFDLTNQPNQIIELDSIIIFEKIPFGLAQVSRSLFLWLPLCIISFFIIIVELRTWLGQILKRHRKSVLFFVMCSLVFFLCLMIVAALDGKDLTLSQGINITDYTLENGLFSGLLVDGKRLTVTSDDPWIVLDVEQFPVIKHIEFNFRNAFLGNSQLYYIKSGGGFSEENSLKAYFKNDERRSFSLPKDKYSFVRFDLTNEPNQIIELDSIVLFEKVPIGSSQIIKSFILCLVPWLVLFFVIFPKKQYCLQSVFNQLVSAWNSADKTSQFRIAVLICTLATMVFFFRIFLGEIYSPVNFYAYQPALPWSAYGTSEVKGTLLSDVIDVFIPGIEHFKNGLSTGSIDLWNSFNGIGSPVTDSARWLVPINWIHLIFPTSISVCIVLIFKVFFTQLGMYILLREFDLDFVPSLIGGFIFSFSMPMVVWLNWDHTTVSMLAPWMFFAVKKVLNGNKRYYVLFSVLLFWMLALNMPAYCAYFLYIISGYCLITLIDQLLKNENITAFFQDGMLYVVTLVFGLGLAAIYIIPFFEMNSFTSYIENRISINLGQAALEPWAFVTQFAPNARINVNIHTNEYSSYFGVVPFMLSVYSIVILKTNRIKGFNSLSAAFIVLFCFLFRVPGFSFIGKLPLISSSVGIRLVMLLAFCAAIIASKGLDVLLKQGRSLKGVWAALLSAVCLIALLFYYGTTSIIDFSITGEMITGLIVLIAGMILIIILLLGKKKIQIIVSILLIVLVAFDMIRGGIDYNPSVIYKKHEIAPPTQITAFLQESLGDERFLPLGSWTLFPTSNTMYKLTSLSYRSLIATKSEIANYYLAMDADSQKSVTKYTGGNIIDYALLSMASVRYIVTPEPIKIYGITVNENTTTGPEGINYIRTVDNLLVYENTQALPRAYLTDNVVAIEDKESALKFLVNSADRSIAVTEKSLNSLDGMIGVQKLANLSVNQNKVTAITNAENDNLLVLTDLYYPGWEVYVDGKKEDVLNVNTIFRGVYVSAGNHIVEFIYRPKSLFYGMLISVISAIGLFLYYVLFLRKYPKTGELPITKLQTAAMKKKDT